MITIKKKFGFTSATIVFDDEKIKELAVTKPYSSITAVSYHELNLPGFRVKSKPTSLIDLTIPETEIFRRFSDTTRNEIHRAERNPDLVFRAPDPDFTPSYQVYTAFEHSQGRAAFAKTDMKIYQVFGAYYKGEFISGLYVTASAPYLRVRSIFSKRLNVEDKEMQKIISNATRGVIWEICKWGKVNNYVSLDLASVNDTNPKSAAIAKFKLSFGGPIMPEYTYIYESTAFRLAARIIPLLNYLKKIFRFS